MIVRVGAPSDNELRMMRPPAISGTKVRADGDDDFVTIHYDKWASPLFQNSQPRDSGRKDNTKKRGPKPTPSLRIKVL